MAARTNFLSALRQCQAALTRAQPTTPSAALFSTTARSSSLKETPSTRLASLTSRPSAPSNEFLTSLITTSNAYSPRARGSQQREPLESQIAAKYQTDKYLDQMPRRWRKGDVYAPRDLSPVEQARWKKYNPPRVDIVDVMGFNPVDNYRNFAMISEHMSSAGRINHSRETGLRAVNQRKMAKAIRRAIGMGLHPSVHVHPELLLNASRRLPHAVLPSTQLPPNARATRFRRPQGA